MKENGAAKVEEVDFNPLWDYVLMEPIKDEVTKGGIHLPDGASVDNTTRSRVIKTGPGAYRDNGTFVPNPIKVGDIVYHLANRMPFKVVLKGKQYLCISGRDCVATAVTDDK